MDPRPIIAAALAQRGVEPLAETVERWYAIVSQWEVRPLYPLVAEKLRALHAEGYRLGLISNVLSVQDGHRALFRQAGIYDLFEVMVFSSEFGLNKPSPAIFLHALESMGIAADGAWYIGDKPHRDVNGAHAAGMTAVLVDSAYHHRIHDAPENVPDLRIPDISHLPAYLRRMASELG
jgi:HAD superfamily hydrolase (TIGR01662 family)